MYNVDLSKGESVRFVALGTSCTVSIQDITLSSPSNTEFKYWSPSTSTWSDTVVTIPMTVSPSESDIYFYTFSASVISPNTAPQQYLVITKNGLGEMLDAMIVCVGSRSTQQLDRIVRAVAPAGRTLSRVTDTSIQISCFDDTALTQERLRLLVVQDSSGNQPEETQTDISSSIT